MRALASASRVVSALTARGSTTGSIAAAVATSLEPATTTRAGGRGVASPRDRAGRTGARCLSRGGVAVARTFAATRSTPRGWSDDHDGGARADDAAFASPPPRRPHRRVVVTGVGLATPLGVGRDLVWDGLVAGRSGVRALRREDIAEGERGWAQMTVRVGARVPRGTRPGEFDEKRWCDGELKGVAGSGSDESTTIRPAVGGGPRIAPFTGLALAAAAEALADAGWDASRVTDEQRNRAGVAIGAGMGHVADLVNAGALLERGKLRRVSPFFVPRILVNMAAGHVSMAHGLRGPNHAAATACATGAHAIGDAFRAVQRGDADVMVAGGTESCVDPVSYVGFARARALADPAAMTPRASKTKKKDKDIYNGSGEDVTEGCTDDVDPSTACRPFDATRAGFVMGEGAGVLVLESLESARRRGAIPYAEIRGYGQASDAHHITQPPSDGAGASRAMRAALEDGGVRPEDVGYVNAHATGTVVGDAAESRALATVFQERYLRGRLSVSSTKGATGHLLGAAGAVEAAFAVLALSTKTLPPTLHLETPCPNAAPAGADLVPLIARVKPGLRAAMTNSFGFGGTNASLVFTSPPGRGGDAE